jgi:hypothetical protein
MYQHFNLGSSRSRPGSVPSTNAAIKTHQPILLRSLFHLLQVLLDIRTVEDELAHIQQSPSLISLGSLRPILGLKVVLESAHQPNDIQAVLLVQTPSECDAGAVRVVEALESVDCFQDLAVFVGQSESIQFVDDIEVLPGRGMVGEVVCVAWSFHHGYALWGAFDGGIGRSGAAGVGAWG